MIIKKTVVSIILLLSLFMSFFINANPVYATESEDLHYTIEVSSVNVTEVEQFVTRLYHEVLGRTPDPTGLTDWTDALLLGVPGATVAHSFFFSPEFLLRTLNNGQYVDILYNTLLGRPADPTGRADWVGILDSGFPREDIFAGFVNSTEFELLCSRYGIVQGSYTPPPGGLIRVFVTRLYQGVLGRAPDPKGLADWTDVLLLGVPGSMVAHDFFFSTEFLLRPLNNGQYIDILYETLLGRPADPVGRANWVGVLDSGFPREDIFAGFVNSAEFALLCARYGIVQGVYTPPPGGPVRVFVTRLYRGLFNNDPDPATLNSLTESILRGAPGAAVAYSLVFGQEMNNRKLSNTDFVDVLFRALLERNPTSSERAYFVSQLNNGASAFDIFAAIINYTEFANFCIAFNVSPGRAVDPSRPMVALTYDDGPTGVTDLVLDVLEKYNVSATFYVNGGRIAGNESIVLRTFNQRNEIGNHGWSHDYLTRLSFGAVRNEIVMTGNAVKAITGVWPATLRPGYGAFNANVITVAAENGMPIVNWTLHGEYTGSRYLSYASDVASHVINNTGNGEIILLHDTYINVVAATEHIIIELTRRGFQFVTVSELLYYSNANPRPGQVFGQTAR